MKTLRLLPFLFGAFAFAFAFLLPTLPLVAQTAPVDAAAAATATGDATSTTTLVSIALAVIAGLVAIWKNAQASTAQKITQSIVLGVEQATKLPHVQAAEAEIKATIRRKAQELGVQPLLHEIVKDLT